MNSIVLRGAPNFRDLGGLPTRDHARVRRGRVFRSELLHRLDDEDLARLRDTGIAAVCDLRHGVERERHVNRWPEGMRPHVIGAAPGEGLQAVQNADLQRRIHEPDFDLDEARRVLLAGYRRMPEVLAPALRAVFAHLLADAAGPLLIHCTSGKDRSGFVCAVLLRALEVPDAVIWQDYLLSREHVPLAGIREMMRRAVPTLSETRIDALAELASVHADYLHAAFAQIDADYGSVERYLDQALGLDAARRETLQAQLLERP